MLGDYAPATFTTRMSQSVGGPETTLFASTTREVAVQHPGNPYPTYRVLVTPPGGGTVLLRNCVTADQGAVYRFRGRIEGNGLGDGVARLVGSATAPVRFSVAGTDSDWGFVGGLFVVTATAVDTVYTPAADISSLSACVVNTSATTASVSFELSAG